MADAVLAKSDDYVQFKRTIDNLLAQRFSIGFYIDRITKMASPYLTDTKKLKELTKAAILDNRKKFKLISYLQENIESKDILSLMLKVIEIAIGIAAS